MPMPTLRSGSRAKLGGRVGTEPATANAHRPSSTRAITAPRASTYRGSGTLGNAAGTGSHNTARPRVGVRSSDQTAWIIQSGLGARFHNKRYANLFPEILPH